MSKSKIADKNSNDYLNAYHYLVRYFDFFTSVLFKTEKAI